MKNKRRKNILAQTKGYRFGRKSKERVAKEAIRHAGVYAFRHRKALAALAKDHPESFTRLVEQIKA